jgi:two-component system, chemotaxis family, chemotaxis protein CheY
MRVLVIDDSEGMRSVLCRLLGELGFDTAVEAVHGGDALNRLEKQGVFDLAVVDWNMPHVNGYEFVTRVRSQNIYDSMKILMVTAEGEILQIDRALKAGANEYIMKPFDLDILISKLRLMGFPIPDQTK